MSNKWSSPSFDNCTFMTNIAKNEGGGLHDHDSSSKISNCIFKDNKSPYAGGIGVFIETHADATQITNCTFINNHADSGAGAIRNYTASSIITKCTFTSNSAAWGGAIEATKSTVEVKDCLFDGNFVKANGGGILNNTGSKMQVKNCRFVNNMANNGGGLANVDSELSLTNSLFHDNRVSIYGGGIHSSYSSLKVINCLLVNNQSDGGGAFYSDRSDLKMINSIVRGNTVDELKSKLSKIEIGYSNVYVTDILYPGNIYPGENNININPLLTSNYTLSRNSPCIDVGNNSVISNQLIDLSGDQRIQDGNNDGKTIVDMGPYEYNFTVDQPVEQNLISDISDTAIIKGNIIEKPTQSPGRRVEPFLYGVLFIIFAACFIVGWVIIHAKIKNYISRKSS